MLTPFARTWFEEADAPRPESTPTPTATATATATARTIPIYDTNIQLDLGQANNSLFGAGLFSPRVWNGSITYSVVPAPASLALIGLGGLVAVRRRR